MEPPSLGKPTELPAINIPNLPADDAASSPHRRLRDVVKPLNSTFNVQNTFTSESSNRERSQLFSEQLAGGVETQRDVFDSGLQRNLPVESLEARAEEQMLFEYERTEVREKNNDIFRKEQQNGEEEDDDDDEDEEEEEDDEDEDDNEDEDAGRRTNTEEEIERRFWQEEKTTPSLSVNLLRPSYVDQMTRVIERGSRLASTRLQEITHDDEMDVDECDDENSDEYEEEPASYHSGDSDEYEMDHRHWLERTVVKSDIRALHQVKGFYHNALGTYRYKVVDRLGEGTFSSVYMAYDNLHNLHDNKYWTGRENNSEIDNLYYPSAQKVAMKKILVTSSPARIESELFILECIRGCRHVSPLITAFRDEDNVIIVLPYHPSDDFRFMFRHLEPYKIKQYMTCLLRALKDIHKRGIIHRDVKPANFLFDYESGNGMLVDFGLAERYVPPRRATCQHEPATRASLHGQRTRTPETTIVEQAVYDARKLARLGEGKVGFRQEDPRMPIKTNRAGTRGFRAPEVLLKCPDQTVAIDVWSAGIILLSFLARRFPVFNSKDDYEALMELAVLYGRHEMEKCALLHNRTFISNLPSLDETVSLSTIILTLNPHLYTPHQPFPTPEEASEHINMIDDALDLCSRLLRPDATRRITAAAALHHRFIDMGAEENDELLCITDGKCGGLHYIEDGRHYARFGESVDEMQFGQGIPESRDAFCPAHQHWQERCGANPIGAAMGASMADDYYQYVGYRVLPEHEYWDDGVWE